MSPLLYSILVEIAPTQCLQQENPEMVYYNISSFNEFFKKVSFILLVIGQHKSKCCTCTMSLVMTPNIYLELAKFVIRPKS